MKFSQQFQILPKKKKKKKEPLNTYVKNTQRQKELRIIETKQKKKKNLTILL